MGKECLLKGLENKSDIEYGPRTQGVTVRVKERDSYTRGKGPGDHSRDGREGGGKGRCRMCWQKVAQPLPDLQHCTEQKSTQTKVGYVTGQGNQLQESIG